MAVPLITARVVFALARGGASLTRAGGLNAAALGRALKDAARRGLQTEAQRFIEDAQSIQVGFFAKTTPGEVLQRAYFHEFGTVNVPERSFLRSTVNKNKARYAKLAAQLAKRVAAKKMTSKQALDWLGIEVASDVQSTIQRNIRPRLKPATVAAKKRKGYARPNIALFATGEMFDALAYKLVKHTGRR